MFHAERCQIRGDRIRRLEGAFKIRVTDSMRIPFYFRDDPDGIALVFGDIGDHDDGVAMHARTALELKDAETVEWTEFTVEASGDEVPVEVPLYREWDEAAHARLLTEADADLPLWLHPRQVALVQASGPLLVRGGAGTGKTAVAVHRLLSTAGCFAEVHGRRPRQLYLTASERLRREAEAWYDRLSSTAGDSKPVFKTVEGICREIVGADDHHTPDRHLNLTRFKLRGVRRFDPNLGFATDDVLWEEVMGLIKAGPEVVTAIRGAEGEVTPHLVREAEARNAQRATPAAIDAYNEVTKLLRRERLWDDVDLARDAYATLLRASSSFEAFDEVVVDEAQDLNFLQLALAIRLCKSPANIFLAGDHLQAILPSRFGWREGRTMFYEWTGRAQSVEDLKENYRSPGNYIRWAERFLAWRAETLGDDGAELEPVLPDSPLLWLESEAMFPRVASWPPSLMVIVFDLEGEQEATKLFGEGRVFTVYQAKGLERSNVILWRPFSRQFDLWTAIGHLDAEDAMRLPTDRRRAVVHCLNCWNVALTRATRALAIFDETRPGWSIFDEPTATAEQLKAWLADLPKYARRDEYAAQARELLDDGLTAQAAATFREGGYHREAADCYALLERWADAASALDDVDDVAATVAWEKAGLQALARDDLAAAVNAYDRAGNAAEAKVHRQALAARQQTVEDLVRRSRFKEAALLVQKLGDTARAADLFEKAEMWSQAAGCCLELGDLSRASKLYLEAKDWKRARELHARLQDWAAAAHASEMLREYQRAGDYFELAGLILEAATAYRTASQLKEEARVLKRAAEEVSAALKGGNSGAWPHWEKVVESLRLAGANEKRDRTALMQAWSSIAQPVSTGEEWLRLAPLASSGQAPDMPAEVWREAATSFEAQEAWSQAAACYRLLGETEAERRSLTALNKSPKVQIVRVAKDRKISARDLMDALTRIGAAGRNHLAWVPEADINLALRLMAGNATPDPTVNGTSEGTFPSEIAGHAGASSLPGQYPGGSEGHRQWYHSTAFGETEHWSVGDQRFTEMRAAGRILRSVHEELLQAIRPRVATRELDAVVADTIRRAGGRPSRQAYYGHPTMVILASVNGEVTRGVPSDRRLQDGEIVTVFAGVQVGAHFADFAHTYLVGDVAPDTLRLVAAAEQSLIAGLLKVGAGVLVAEVSLAIQTVIRAAGFSAVQDFHGLGYGIGEIPRQAPQIGSQKPGPTDTTRFEVGQGICIYPIVSGGDGSVRLKHNKFTVSTADGALSAAFAQTVLVHQDGVEIPFLSTG